MPPDFTLLRLKANGDPKRLDDILQTECRQRFAAKFPLALASPDFRFPDPLVGEQATSEAIARLHAELIPPDSRVIDLTAGLGIDAFAAARAGSSVVAVEMDHTRAQALRHNARALNLDVEVIEDDCRDALKNFPPDSFDIAFIDPARRDKNGRRLFSLAECQPDVISLIPEILSRAKNLIVKASPMLDISAVKRELPPSADILIVGSASECKELVAVIPGENKISAITLAPEPVFTDLSSDEQPIFCEPRVGDYLCLPWPTVMKAPRLTPIAGAQPIAPNTRLFLSQVPPTDFPGSIFLIEKILPSSRQSFKQLKGIEASISVRNFPMTPEELKKRLQSRESQSLRLFAITSQTSRLLILTSPLPH